MRGYSLEVTGEDRKNDSERRLEAVTRKSLRKINGDSAVVLNLLHAMTSLCVVAILLLNKLDHVSS